MKSLKLGALAAAVLMGSAAPRAAAAGPILLQHPTLSATQIAFDYGGEIWTVPRAGGRAVSLVRGQGRNRRPIFSPDGRWIAFTGTFDGNTDVYVVPAAGGEPRRLTWHPGEDIAVGWTPDGAGVLFTSPRAAVRDRDQLYTVPLGGGAPTRLPIPYAEEASFSPDASHIAYEPYQPWQPAWKRYRGGQTTRIWVADLADSRIVPIPRDNSNDRAPMWVGGTIYFLSDRDGPTTLYAYDLSARTVRRLIDNPRGFDIASASAGPGGIVMDRFGALEIYDTAEGRAHAVPVEISGELFQTRPRFSPVKGEEVLHAALTPTGKRVLLETHGEILSAPVEKGDVRNLSQSPGAADRDPAASPDGRLVAWFSDESGEYALHVAPADGKGPTRKYPLGDPPSYFYTPVFSPDGRRIAFHDKRLNLWILDLSTGGAPKKVDQDAYDSPLHRFDAAWSPDGRWLVYDKLGRNRLHAAFIYSVESGRSRQATDGLSDVSSPRFDRSGKYLYFVATTSAGLATGWLDMSSLGRAQDAAVYALVLRKDLPSPVAPESDEEEPAAGAPGAVKRADAEGGKAGPADVAAKPRSPPAPVVIDFDGLDQRITALPIERANITALETGAEGVVFTATAPKALSDEDQLDERRGPPETLYRFDLKTRKNVKLAEGLRASTLRVSADGSKVLYASGGDWFVKSTDAPKGEDRAGASSSDGSGKLKLEDVSVYVDPRAEWAQMYREVWRIERDFLYDPKLQGLDLDKARRLYARYLDGVAARQDLNVLFEEMTGHIGVGHTFIRGGALPEETPVKVGLLGADYEVADGRYRIARILRGENWNPKLSAPLTQPGVEVHEGEFLLAVNGRPVGVDAEVYRAFEGLAGKQTRITVGPRADGTGARQVTVVPVESEASLRLRTWMEDNRRKVDALSGGRLAYVYLPDTAAGGFSNFNRYYYAQVGKLGAVIDERFNHGGDIADYIVEQLRRTPQMVLATREGERVVEPAAAIFGPKVMIANEMSGSGGDALPWMFKKTHAGVLVGTRTWGGLVGIGGYPELIDGGEVTAPRWAIYGTSGEWEVENIGIAPDVEVPDDPALVRQGRDPQLERAVEIALEELRASPPPVYPAATYPDRKPILPDVP